ncbi:MAG: hypothetical protein L6437_10390 [Kiritimatiellae bacterium]|nr:hypothetical protein [Verrucomicrobiota bacterium]MCG2660638.1 hypothetical protein [Kiritimatiellia bacterium]
MERHEQGWRIRAGGLALELDGKTGSLAKLVIQGVKEFRWSPRPGAVTVRDDFIRKTFDNRDLDHVQCSEKNRILTITKTFYGAPWCLRETYRVANDAICWNAEVILDSGAFRSCAVSYHIPWPQIMWYASFWAAREHMPSAPHRFGEIRLEYGEVTSGILIPAISVYREQENVGLLVAMPFDFKTPRLSFISGYRDPDLQAEFDWMALAPGKPARASLVFRGTPGNWRPALGWLYETYKDYFEPRSTLIDQLWGGHISGGFNVSPEEARSVAELGLKWYEIHAHFPSYGNYHPEGISQWRSGHYKKDPTMISVDMIRRSIRNLHAVGAAALPYLQVTGDGAAQGLSREFDECRIRDRYGEWIYSDYYDCYALNSDRSLPFGKDIIRQIKGMVERYPEMDGVFLDQACYNWLDTAHDDGLTAVDNRPCYMQGFNYEAHLELLSSLLHPHKAIIANGPFGIGVMKYIDGFMAEGSDWLCDHLQYLGVAKPMFFLVYHTTDRDIELMFQRCLIYAAGFSSYPVAKASKDLYDLYLPLLQRLFGRLWVFDAEPLKLPVGFEGDIFRSKNRSLLVSMVNTEPRLGRRALQDCSVAVKTADIDNVRRVTLQSPGGEVQTVPFKKENNGVVFDIPGPTQAAVAELTF